MSSKGIKGIQGPASNWGYSFNGNGLNMTKWIFCKIYKRWLEPYKLVKITGWRSCLAGRVGQIYRLSFCFWWFK